MQFLMLIELQTTLLLLAAAKSLQSCSTQCNPIDGSPPGSPVPGILQARTLEWVAISFSNPWKWKGKVKSLSHVQLSATPWTAAHQAPPSMWFSRQEYWSGVLLPSPPNNSRNLNVPEAGLGRCQQKWETNRSTTGTWWPYLARATTVCGWDNTWAILQFPEKRTRTRKKEKYCAQ